MWSSKSDVMNDAPKISGLGSDFDDTHIVRGSGAPLPYRSEDFDDEMKLMFGEDYNHSSSNFHQSNKPDLKAITDMLRMVDTFDKPDEKQPQREQRNELPNTVVVISKLNPDVGEFIPRFEKIKKSPTKATTTGNNIKAKVNSDQNEKASTKRKTPNPEVVDNGCTELENKQQELKTLERHLKTKITSTSKPATLAQKRERNVAIAALMRLKTGPATPTNSSNSTPKSNSPQPKIDSQTTIDSSGHGDSTKNTLKPELLTPEYFAGPRFSPKVLDVDDNEHRIPEPKELLDPPKSTPSPKELVDPQMKESIEKVNKWLNHEQKPKSGLLAPHSGTVLFKKKESASGSPKSPCSGRSQKSEEDIIVPLPPQEFVPSSYAEKLKKEFNERVKANEEIAKKNQPPPDKLKPLEDVGLSFTFKRRADNCNDL